MSNTSNQEMRPQSGCGYIVVLAFSLVLLSYFAVTAITAPGYITGDTEGEFPRPPTADSIMIVITLSLGLFGLWRWWLLKKKSDDPTVVGCSAVVGCMTLLLFVFIPLWQLLSLCAEYDCL